MNTNQEYIDYLLNSLSWKINYGIAEAEPTKFFWEEWKNSKNTFKYLQIQVTKVDNKWVVRWNDDYYISIIKSKINKPKQIKNIQSYTIKNTNNLLNYQIELGHIGNLVSAIQKYGSCIDGSDTGVGKTSSALAVCREINAKPFIICPKSIIPSWKKMANFIGVEFIEVINVEKLKTWKTQWVEQKINGKKKTIIWNKEIKYIIFDELHRAKSWSSINSKMLIAAKAQGIKIIGLSATVGSNPMDMMATGYLIGLFSDPKYFWSWITNYSCAKGRFGWEFQGGLKDLNRIHEQIYPERGSRISIKELGDKFPDNQIQADIFDIGTNAKKINAIYKKMRKELLELEKKKEGDKNPNNALTIMLRARQEIELIKAPIFIEQIQCLVEEGNSVAVFVNFSETIKTISEQLNINCIIDGKNTDKEREKNINDFQRDAERVILCNSKAGGIGVSLHDINGTYPRVSVISPTFSAIDLKQVLGRIHRIGAKSKAIQKIVYCADTVEERVCEKVKEKIKNIDAINDGDMTNGLF